MIYTRYQDFRAGFALVGAPLAVDGFPEWPYAKLRTGGFANSITFDSPSSTVNLYSQVMNITCNDFAADAVAGVDDYDFFVSQRTDVIANQYFTVAVYAANRSGSIKLSCVTANTALLLPGLTDYRGDEALKLLFRDVAIYVQRRSDKAYQWLGSSDAMG